jgi:hypothetical protein
MVRSDRRLQEKMENSSWKCNAKKNTRREEFAEERIRPR